MDIDIEKLEIKHDIGKNKFYVMLEGKEANLEYEFPVQGKMDMKSTFVPGPYRNNGIASRITRHALSYAKTNNLDVIASCPFIRDFIHRHPDAKKVVVETRK